MSELGWQAVGQSITAFRRFMRGRLASAGDKRSHVENQSRAKDYVGRRGAAGCNKLGGGAAMAQLDIFYIFTCWKRNYPVKGNETRKAFLSPMAPLLHHTVLSTRPTKQVHLHWVRAFTHFVSVLWPLRNKKHSTAAEHIHTRWLLSPLWVFSPNFSAREPLMTSKNHRSSHPCSRKYSVSKITKLYQNRFQKATKITYQHSWFQTFAVFWMLYVFFWVISRRLNSICRRFGTNFPIFISGLVWRMTRFENGVFIQIFIRAKTFPV
jgi:hypothetical protein